MNIESEGQGMDVDFTFDPKDFEAMTSSPISGFKPVIFHITPITQFPQLMLHVSEPEDPRQLSRI